MSQKHNVVVYVGKRTDYNKLMEAEQGKKVLLFITHQPENLKVVTSFLGKRNFSTYVETNIKNAIVQVFELKPDFIFVAWDHTDKKISMLPKLLGQSTRSTIVPFINKNTKDSYFKFETCPYNPKLYPPISGPAIERLILKSSKEDDDYLEKINKFKQEEVKPEVLAAIQQNLANLEINEPPQPPDLEDEESKSVEIEEAPNRIESVAPVTNLDATKLKNSIDEKNTVLDADKKALSQEQKDELKRTLQDQVQAPLENVLASYEQFEPNPVKIKPKSNLIFQKGPPADRSKRGPIIIKMGAKPEKEKSTFNAYCISLISTSWCGYFVVFTKSHLDFNSIDLIFTDWIKMQLKNIDEITERDYFEFEDVDKASIDEIDKLADYHENITARGHDFSICFFAVEAKDMKIEFNDEGDYIKMFTRDVPTEAVLDFNVLLHLPENQKYLLYTQKNSALSEDQKSRLMSKNITQLFTSVENEYDYRKFLAVKTFSRLFEMINNKLSKR